MKNKLKEIENSCYLKRFNTIEDLSYLLDNEFKDYNIRIKEYAFKQDYNNDFQDYELIIILGNENEDIIDLSVYYAITRIGDKIITEVGYELV